MLELSANAKINLGLEILRRRPDGYHDLNTVFAALDFGDTVALASRDDRLITCTTTEADLPGDEDNLAVRAAVRLREHLCIDRGLSIAITKRIPMGAGLGGGSSDAAAVLKGAPIVWETAIRDKESLEIAAGLGSDVSFFLGSSPARASSRGEILEPLAIELPWHVLLVNPGVHVSTPLAFAAIGRQNERSATDLVAAIRAAIEDPAALRKHLVNDFEEVVFAWHPGLAEIKRGLYNAGALFAQMSGSGSTIYGLFADSGAARVAANEFQQFWTMVARFEVTH